MRRAVVSLALIVTLAAGAASAASQSQSQSQSHSPLASQSQWAKSHPRQHKILVGAHRQVVRTNHALHAGQLTGKQAQRLDREGRAIKREDHQYAKINGGFVTKGQLVHMRKQEHGVAHSRRHDETLDASAH
jgi:hypothetical protein